MKIILNDINPKITSAWGNFFEKEANVDIWTTPFQRLHEFITFDDVLVLTSAGNSYGIMGGGLDLAIAQKFPGIQNMVREQIQDIYQGELPIGLGLVIPLLEDQNPFRALIYTPTMRAPTRLRNAENVYVATRCAMRNFRMIQANYPGQFNDATLVMPGFGGVCGGLPADVIANTMYLAYKRETLGYMPSTHTQMMKEDTYITGVCNGKRY